MKIDISLLLFSQKTYIYQQRPFRITIIWLHDSFSLNYCDTIRSLIWQPINKKTQGLMRLCNSI